MSDSIRFRAIAEWLAARFSAAERGDMRVLDLACGGGESTRTWAALGFRDVYGIDIRPPNIRQGRLAQRAAPLANLRYAVADVWSIGRLGGPWDVVVCCGLLYHLDRPRAYLELLARAATRALVLDTHYAMPEVPTFPARRKMGRWEMGAEGLPGRLYREYKSEANRNAVRLARRTGSWVNLKSFWVSRPDLERMLSATWQVQVLPDIHPPELWRAVYCCVKR